VFDDIGGECGPRLVDEKRTESDGCIVFRLPAADYWLELPHTGCAGPWVEQIYSPAKRKTAGAQEDRYGSYAVAAYGCKELTFFVSQKDSGLAFNFETWGADAACAPTPCSNLVVGKPANLRFENTGLMDVKLIEFLFNNKLLSTQSGASGGTSEIALETQRMRAGDVFAEAKARRADGSTVRAGVNGRVMDDIQNIAGEIKTTTSLTRTETEFTEDVAFWTGIRNSTDALSFNTYLRFMDWIFCGGPPPTPGFEAKRFVAKNAEYSELIKKRFLPFTDSDAYRVVKAATEAFVMVNCGVLQAKDRLLQPFDPNRDNAYLDRRDLPTPQNDLDLIDVFNTEYLVNVNRNGGVLPFVLPYLAVIRQKLPDISIKSTAFGEANLTTGKLDNCFGILQEKLDSPCLLELICPPGTRKACSCKL